MAGNAQATIDAVYRSDWGRIVATLIRLVRDFDVAEDAAQDAFADPGRRYAAEALR